MQQAQQPFEGKDATGVVGVLGQLARFGDDQFGMAVRAADADREVGQHDVQEAAGAGQCFGQGRRAQATATEEFEAADAHRLGEQAETFVVQFAIQQVVKRGVAVDWNPAGGVCNINRQSRPAVATGRSGGASGRPACR